MFCSGKRSGLAIACMLMVASLGHVFIACRVQQHCDSLWSWYLCCCWHSRLSVCACPLLFGGQLVATDCEGDIHIGVAVTCFVTALSLLLLMHTHTSGPLALVCTTTCKSMTCLAQRRCLTLASSMRTPSRSLHWPRCSAAAAERRKLPAIDQSGVVRDCLLFVVCCLLYAFIVYGIVWYRKFGLNT